MQKPQNKSTPVIIYGAGGHGCVVAESAIAMGLNVTAFIDISKDAKPILDLPVIHPDNAKPEHGNIIIAIGDNPLRQKITEELTASGWKFATVIHPTACISPTATIGKGTYIGPMATVNSLAALDEGVILNTGGIIEHHNHIQAFAHLAPGVTTGGMVSIGERALVGINASILPSIKIGNDTAIGAGSVVTQNILPNAVAWGNPARVR